MFCGEFQRNRDRILCGIHSLNQVGIITLDFPGLKTDDVNTQSHGHSNLGKCTVTSTDRDETVGGFNDHDISCFTHPGCDRQLDELVRLTGLTTWQNTNSETPFTARPSSTPPSFTTSPGEPSTRHRAPSSGIPSIRPS